MRICSRVSFVGFLLIWALIVSGCQPVQPPTPSTSEAINTPALVEDEPVTNSATITENATIIASQVVSPPVVSTGTSTDTTTVEITPTSETSATGIIIPPAVVDVEVGTVDNIVDDPALLAAGLSVYRAQYCGVCHELDAAETRGTFGPDHNDMGAIAAERLQDANYQGLATTAVEYIRESIVDPQIYIVPGYATTPHRMPPYAHLDSESLDALVAFLAAQ